MKHDNIIFPKPNIASHFIVHKSYNYSFWLVINNSLLHVYSLPPDWYAHFLRQMSPRALANQSFFFQRKEIPIFIKIMAIILQIIPWKIFLLMQYDISVRFLLFLFHLSPLNNLMEVNICMCNYLLKRYILYSSMN